MIESLTKKEVKSNLKILIGMIMLLQMYNIFMVEFFDPQKSKLLDTMMTTMGGIYSAFGMKAGPTGLLGFLSNYLYGFIMVIIPFIFDILIVFKLMGSYLDDGSMAYLLSSNHKRKTIIQNQMIISTIMLFILIGSCALSNIIQANATFPGELDNIGLLKLNFSAFILHLFFIGFNYFITVIFVDGRKSLGISTGFFLISYLFQMLGNIGGKMAYLEKFSIISLFNREDIIKSRGIFTAGTLILLLLAIILHMASRMIFSKKDIHV